jgi:hypothetical protein
MRLLTLRFSSTVALNGINVFDQITSQAPRYFCSRVTVTEGSSSLLVLVKFCLNDVTFWLSLRLRFFEILGRGW